MQKKASSLHFLHFLHFLLTEAQAASFRTPNTRVLIGFQHSSYGPMTMMPEETRAALADDPDSAFPPARRSPPEA